MKKNLINELIKQFEDNSKKHNIKYWSKMSIGQFLEDFYKKQPSLVNKKYLRKD